MVFFCSSVSVVLLDPQVSQRVVIVESSSLLHRGRFIDFNYCHDDILMSLEANSQLNCENRSGR